MGKLFIGIDPGMEGAVVRVGDGPGDLRIVDTPVLSGTGKRVYDEVACARALEEMIQGREADCSVAIEAVHSMPRQGVASSFTFGTGYGIWLGIIAALRIPSVRVAPQRWKKDVLADGPKTDQAVVAVGGRLYPGAAPLLVTARGKLLLGRADGLLIAHWLKTSGRA